MQGNIKSESTTMKRKGGRIIGFLISTLIIATWISALYLLFSRFMSKNYFRWYVENGTLISLATSFLALVWEGLEEQKGLLSWHPGNFLRSCFELTAIFYSAIAANMAGPLDGIKHRADEPISIGEALWDAVFAFIMALIMAVAVLGWLLFVAPLHYLITLFTGAPARREIRDTGIKLFVQSNGFTTTIIEQPSSAEIPNGSTDVSFGVRPFALTNALNAAVLFLAKLLLPATG